MNRDELTEYIRNRYGTEPDCPFPDDTEDLVFRHGSNRKWFALMMRISSDKLGLSGQDTVDIINLKCDPVLVGNVLSEPGIFPAYHMNKTHWITIALDGSAADDMLEFLLDRSYDATAPGKGAKVPKEKL